ncbi:hypothetical protein BDQ12DRAFT_715639 [Crucibulum laeve]|uniref:Uncharacterized protein n=1 Tax=Crucibulum laeve TaxID=68775 RepID=A0A5C3LMH8_9AGAR|nr:hypothetical protein BDQ12DRAFT_715639 [Crucibulum laeve]
MYLAISQGESVHDDRERCYPERYFDIEDGNLKDNDEVLALGFGRIKWVGKYMGSSAMHLVIASILPTFESKKAAGDAIETDDKYTELHQVHAEEIVIHGRMC